MGGIAAHRNASTIKKAAGSCALAGEWLITGSIPELATKRTEKIDGQADL